MPDYTINQLYDAIQSFRAYIQANMPYKATIFFGTTAPNTGSGQLSNVGTLFIETDPDTDALVEIWIKVSPTSNTGWAPLSSGGGIPDAPADDTQYARINNAWQEVEQYAFSGYSARFNEQFSSTDTRDTLAKILNLQYVAPTVSLTASGSTTIREKGLAVTSTSLSANITKKSNNISQVRFYKDAVLIHTVPSPNPNGGTEVYNWTGSFSDTTSFSVQVDDAPGNGGPTTVSDTKTFTFVYPYYVGADSQNIAIQNVSNLTQLDIISTATVNRTITATAGQVFYFAYPASYPALTSILDVNGFNVFPDWTLRTGNIVGLDSTSQSYRVYEFNNPVIDGDYYFSFRR